MLGSGAIIVIDDSVPIVEVALRLAEFYRHESCGKCTPCREGTNWTVKMLERVDRGEATPMDIEIIAQVQENIIGNCLCVLGDSMAMPIGSMIEKFRDEFEEHIERRRQELAQQDYGLSAQELGAARRPALPRPEPRMVTFEIDGREVTAPEGAMLVDGAKYGDVEIPVFCYEPKLGPPVGACRMCLVEIEGIPKLQTACSTPVKDGMVVVTTSDRVKHAQEAVVEFLLINHPLDCPVCDKGGECPLQDISFGWGAGPLAHDRAEAPLQEADRAVAADRDRPRALHPLLPLRALLAGGRRGLPARLPRARRPHLRRHATTARRTSRRSAATSWSSARWARSTSTSYRFRARPWDIEDSGSICALCPSQCNVEFTVRDDARIVRVMARDNEDVEDGWLCDKGRYGYQAVHSPERHHAAAGPRGRRAARGVLGARARGGGRRAEEGRRRDRGAGRRRDHERGGLPAPAPAARGARLAARRLAPERRARPRPGARARAART